MLAFSMLLVTTESKSTFRQYNISECISIIDRQAWIALGNMSKEQAKEDFIKLMLERCPMFQHHLEAHHVENEEQDRMK